MTRLSWAEVRAGDTFISDPDDQIPPYSYIVLDAWDVVSDERNEVVVRVLLHERGLTRVTEWSGPREGYFYPDVLVGRSSEKISIEGVG